MKYADPDQILKTSERLISFLAENDILVHFVTFNKLIYQYFFIIAIVLHLENIPVPVAGEKLSGCIERCNTQ